MRSFLSAAPSRDRSPFGEAGSRDEPGFGVAFLRHPRTRHDVDRGDVRVGVADEDPARGEGGWSPGDVRKDLEARDFPVLLWCGLDDVERALLGQDHEVAVDEDRKAVSRRPGFPVQSAGRGVDAAEEASAESVDMSPVVDRSRIVQLEVRRYPLLLYRPPALALL